MSKYADIVMTGTHDEQISRVQLHMGALHDEKIRLEKELQRIEVSYRISQGLVKRLIAERPKP